MKSVAVTRNVGLACSLTLLAWSGAAGAESAPGGERTPYVITSALGSVLYTPLKGLLCLTGGMGSGFTFLSSGPTAAKAVASASCKGEWVLTPGVVRGTEPFGFVGEIDQTPGR